LTDAWRKKKQRAAESRKPMGDLAPNWLELIDGAYKPIHPHDETVKTIFKLSIEGLGAQRILGRVAEAVARPGSHRSGRAQLRHPARQLTDSLRTATLWPEATAAQNA
jgi:hypothetical protein